MRRFLSDMTVPLPEGATFSTQPVDLEAAGRYLVKRDPAAITPDNPGGTVEVHFTDPRSVSYAARTWGNDRFLPETLESPDGPPLPLGVGDQALLIHNEEERLVLLERIQ